MGIRVPPDSTGKIVETITLTDHRQVFIQGGDNAIAERASVKNTAPAATDYGGTVRAIQRREGQTLSTAALGGAGVFTQGAQDGNEDGSVFVAAVAEADVNSAAQGFVIQEYDGDDDDFTDASHIRTVAAATYTASSPQYLYARIRGRKWRVQFTNGGTGQANFKLTAASSAIVQDHHLDYDSGAGTVELPVFGIALPGSGGPVAGGTAANPFTVTLSSGAVSDPQTSSDTDAAVAAGGQATLDSTQISSGKTGKLLQIIVAASVPFKAVFQTVLNGVATSRVTYFTGPGERSWTFRPFSQDMYTVVEDAAAGFDGFRVVVDNQDTSEPADLYASFEWDEV